MYLVGFLPFFAFANDGFSITGNISGIKSGSISILSYSDGTEESPDVVHADKVRIEGGQFVFKGHVDHPCLVKLKISTRSITFFLENTDYTLEGVLNTLSDSSLVGGTANDDFVKFSQSGYSMTEFIKACPGSIVSGYLGLRLSTEDFGLAKDCYSWLDASVKDSWYGKQIKKIIEQYERSAALVNFPDLGMKLPTGASLSLEQFRGKVVVLDFWASWCAPCRAYIPKMKALYNEYNGKDVAFVSISGDDDSSDWKVALNKEKMPWVQALADGGFSGGGGIKRLLSIYHIPYVIILDKNGKIATRLDADHKDEIKTSIDGLL